MSLDILLLTFFNAIYHSFAFHFVVADLEVSFRSFCTSKDFFIVPSCLRLSGLKIIFCENLKVLYFTVLQNSG